MGRGYKVVCEAVENIVPHARHAKKGVAETSMLIENVKLIGALLAALALVAPQSAAADVGPRSSATAGATISGIALSLAPSIVNASIGKPIKLLVEIRNIDAREALVNGVHVKSSYRFTVIDESNGKMLPRLQPVSNVYAAGAMHLAARRSWYESVNLEDFVQIGHRGSYKVTVESANLRLGDSLEVVPLVSNAIIVVVN